MELTEGNVSTYVMDEVGLPKPDKKVQVSRVSITKAKLIAFIVGGNQKRALIKVIATHVLLA